MPTGFELSKMVSQISLPRAECAVLRALADHHSQKHEDVWPSVATISRESKYSERTCRDALRSLEYVYRLIRLAEGSSRKGGRKKSVHYVIDVEAIQSLLNPAVAAGKEETRQSVHGNKAIVSRNPATVSTETTETRQPLPPNKEFEFNKTTTTATNTEKANADAVVSCLKANPTPEPIVEAVPVADTKSIPPRRLRAQQVAADMEVLYDKDYSKPWKDTKAHREKLEEIILAYGGTLTIIAWKKYLSEYDSLNSWPLKGFVDKFVTYLRKAEADSKFQPDVEKVRIRLFHSYRFFPDFRDTLSADELRICEEANAARGDFTGDFTVKLNSFPLHLAGTLLDIEKREHDWMDKNAARIKREEKEYYQQHKDEVDVADFYEHADPDVQAFIEATGMPLLDPKKASQRTDSLEENRNDK